MSLLAILKTIPIVGKVVNTVSNNRLARQVAKHGDASKKEDNTSKEFLASMDMIKAQYGAKNRTWIESFVGAFNSLIRPSIAILLILPIVMHCLGFNILERLVTLSKLPEWYITLTVQVILAFFGLREIGKTVTSIASKVKTMKPEQFEDFKKMVHEKTKTITENQEKIHKEKEKHTEILNSFLDENNDGLDDRGMHQLADHEGFRSKLYKCTAGKWTIGFGFNLEDTGMTIDEATYLLANKARKFKTELFKALPWIPTKLGIARQWVLINMCFNLGLAGLLKWNNTLALIEKGEYKKAARMMKRSKWARQVKSRRADPLCKQMETGEFA